MVGEMLGNRYSILEKLGEGGMAIVYKAQCTLLNRVVAVKVLRPQYASDEEFVERFRREAQAAAGLSHPNIVSIYDVGQDGDRYYIVMEYVKGKSLKDMIRKSGPLAPPRAAWIAFQIAEALDHAHRNNIIHRDIKPHNILVTENGMVKVADFGIARAQSTETLTETGIVIGTVSYFSPEQARGASAGVASDIYSLGVVLYEMLTGRVPFRGESPISIALKHIQEKPDPPRSLNPDIPAGLDRIVMKALEKDPSRRYTSASDMAAELERFIGLDGLPILIPDGVMAEDLPTQVMTTQEFGMGRSVPPASRGGADAISRGGKVKKADRRGVHAIVWAIIIVISMLSLGVLGAVKIPEWLYVQDVVVPDFVGKTVDEARMLASGAKIRLDDTEKRYDDKVEAGRIISQRPQASEKVKMNGKVYVVVSLGKEMVEVPDLRGLSLREAELRLENLELSLGTQQEDFSADIPEGRIATQSPDPGTRVEKHIPVDVVISKGPEPAKIVVPDLIGKTLEDASSQLRSLGLVIGKVDREAHDRLRRGLIISQYPPAGAEVEKDAPVDFIVSAGPGPGTGLGIGTGTETGQDQGSSKGESDQGASESDAQTPTATVVQVTIPSGHDLQELKIVINDFYGEREVYRGMHSPGEKVEQKVVGYGQRIRVRVYIEGILYRDEWVKG